MNLKYLKVSIFEISYKKKNELFHHIQISGDVPVYGLPNISYSWLMTIMRQCNHSLRDGA